MSWQHQLLILEIIATSLFAVGIVAVKDEQRGTPLTAMRSVAWNSIWLLVLVTGAKEMTWPLVVAGSIVVGSTAISVYNGCAMKVTRYDDGEPSREALAFWVMAFAATMVWLIWLGN